MTTPLIIFTDLDGSLLDHHHYGFEPAVDTLNKLQMLGIPVVFNSSKTVAEQLKLRQEADNQCPFITENGAGAYLPKSSFADQPDDSVDLNGYWVKGFCPPREHWLAVLEEVEAEFEGEFQGFSKADIKTLIEWTGLEEDQARLASQRFYSEPVRWLGTDERASLFRQRLQQRGAKVLQGGRFMHVCGEANKGHAMTWLRDFYQQSGQAMPSTKTLAIGDSHNDVDMLEAADYALVIKSPVHEPLSISGKVPGETLLYSDAYGPEGWAQGVEKFLQILNIGHR